MTSRVHSASSSQPLVLTEDEVRDLLSVDDAISAVRGAFSQAAQGHVSLLAGERFIVDQHSGEFVIRGAYVHTEPYFCLKVATGFYNNPTKGLPVGGGMMLLFNAGTGELASVILDNGYLGALRTGAGGAVATDVLAKKTVERVLLVGTGRQARHQLESLLRVRSPELVEVYVRTEGASAIFAREMGDRTGCAIVPAGSLEEAASAADLVITATSAHEPFLRAEWLKPGSHVTAIGAKHELFPEVFEKADKIVVDSRQECLAHGDICFAVEAGSLQPEGISAELGEITSGMLPGREVDDEITVAVLSGLGFQDAAVGTAVLDEARRRRVGRPLA